MLERSPDFHSYRGTTYYGTPALKAAPWDWKVPLYVALGGLAGGAQVIAGAARIVGGSDTVVRTGRYLGAVGAILGAPLLIYDLKTPQRWYNMVRIFRPTSPMSIGSYVLISFGAFSTLTALGQAASSGRTATGRGASALADAAQVPAAVTGALMGTYTAALLSATSTPLWAAEPELLAARFGASAMGSGAAALSIGEHLAGEPENTRRLDGISALSTGVGLVAAIAADRRYEQAGLSVQKSGQEKQLHRAALFLGYAVPLACHGINLVRRRPSPALSVAAGLATIAGSWLMRSSVFQAGYASAVKPTDSLGFAQPENLPHEERRTLTRTSAFPERRGRTRLQRMASQR